MTATHVVCPLSELEPTESSTEVEDNGGQNDEGQNTLRGEHRPKKPGIPFPESLLVARPVNRAEVLQKPKAQAALRKEWDRLRAIN
eukprot:4515826-Alexandrium_andersonii.AAC.1